MIYQHITNNKNNNEKKKQKQTNKAQLF